MNKENSLFILILKEQEILAKESAVEYVSHFELLPVPPCVCDNGTPSVVTEDNFPISRILIRDFSSKATKHPVAHYIYTVQVTKKGNEVRC